MRSLKAVVVALVLCAPSAAAQTGVEGTLDIYVIDVEGGNATLFVGPSGESMLIDTGSAGGRDAQRIFDAATHAGLAQIDHLVTSHYHTDHAGGAAELAALIPIRHFIDNGPEVQSGPHIDFEFMERVYPELLRSGAHTVARPGDRIPISGLDVTIVSAGGDDLSAPLPGGGASNPYCAGFHAHTINPTLGGPVGNTEDERSVGIHVRYGEFRAAHMTDLTWNREFDLMCPANPIGTVDVFFVSRHGQPSSNSEVLVHAIEPRVAIMNNGPRKGGQPEVMRILYSAPRLIDTWQMHFSVLSGQEYAVPGMFIANVYDEQPGNRPIAPLSIPPGGAGAPPPAAHDGAAYWIRVSARPDGSFTVTNSRNAFTRSYPVADLANSAANTAAPATQPGGMSTPAVVEEVVEARLSTRYQLLELTRVVGGLRNPWAIAFLPDGRMLVTERPGRIQLVDGTTVTGIGGVPEVSALGQGGMLDLALHPDYETNGWIYMTYTRGAGGEETVLAVGRARLDGATLVGFEEIFVSNEPTSTSFFRYGSRLVFLEDGTLLVSVGDRGMGDWRGIRDSAQDTRTHTGSIVRLNDDGSVPTDNPYFGRPDFAPEIFTYGHRNIQGMVRHPHSGQVWAIEFGPLAGDELNLIEAGNDYGWPNASEGRHYDDQSRWYRGRHSDTDAVVPVWSFFPNLAPSGLSVVAHTNFDERWDGNLLAGGLLSEWLLRIVLENGEVVHIEEILKGEIGRIRDVRVGPDGNIYLASDELDGGVYRLSPVID